MQVHSPEPTAAASSSGDPLGSSSARRALATRGDQGLNVQACQNCHGPGGTGFGNVNPYLAGLDRRYLETALGEWRSGSRKTDPSQQMNHIANNLGDADIKALAAYFASQPPPQPATVAAQKPPRIGAPRRYDRRQRAGALGPAEHRVWTTDLSTRYVELNMGE